MTKKSQSTPGGNVRRAGRRSGKGVAAAKAKSVVKVPGEKSVEKKSSKEGKQEPEAKRPTASKRRAPKSPESQRADFLSPTLGEL
ncbi:MAG: hypothetical protein ACREA9_08645, partial [Pyrinomonadaceae bacterium]